MYLVYLVRLFICLLCVNYVHSTCAECTSWLCYVYYVMLCYGRFGRCLVLRISVPSLTLCHFVHLTNKRLVTLPHEQGDREDDLQRFCPVFQDLAGTVCSPVQMCSPVQV